MNKELEQERCGERSRAGESWRKSKVNEIN